MSSTKTNRNRTQKTPYLVWCGMFMFPIVVSPCRTFLLTRNFCGIVAHLYLQLLARFRRHSNLNNLDKWKYRHVLCLVIIFSRNVLLYSKLFLSGDENKILNTLYGKLCFLNARWKPYHLWRHCRYSAARNSTIRKLQAPSFMMVSQSSIRAVCCMWMQ